MRILHIRPGHEQEDTESGRRVLDAEIAKSSNTTLIIRGADPETSNFAEKAAGRADPFPDRILVGYGGNLQADHDRAFAFISLRLFSFSGSQSQASGVP